MKAERLALNLMLVGLGGIPLLYLVQKVAAAPAAPNTLRTELLLQNAPSYPLFDQIKRIEQPLIATYITKKGDTIWQLAKKLNFSREDVETVRSSNGLDFGVFSEGTVLRIPNHKGTLYDVAAPEDLRSICQGYTLGKRFGHVYEEQVLVANGFPLPSLAEPEHRFEKGTTLFLPEVYKPYGFPIPLPGKIRFSSGFGRRRHPVTGVVRRHLGVDIPKPYGTIVRASLRGTVTFAGWMGGYGNMVEIRHTKKRGNEARTFYTRYGHLSSISVHEGQSVGFTTIIGHVGSTGLSTGPHLHFEVRDGSGRAMAPQ